MSSVNSDGRYIGTPNSGVSSVSSAVSSGVSHAHHSHHEKGGEVLCTFSLTSLQRFVFDTMSTV